MHSKYNNLSYFFLIGNLQNPKVHKIFKKESWVITQAKWNTYYLIYFLVYCIHNAVLELVLICTDFAKLHLCLTVLLSQFPESSQNVWIRIRIFSNRIFRNTSRFNTRKNVRCFCRSNSYNV